MHTQDKIIKFIYKKSRVQQRFGQDQQVLWNNAAATAANDVKSNNNKAALNHLFIFKNSKKNVSNKRGLSSVKIYLTNLFDLQAKKSS